MNQSLCRNTAYRGNNRSSLDSCLFGQFLFVLTLSPSEPLISSRRHRALMSYNQGLPIIRTSFFCNTLYSLLCVLVVMTLYRFSLYRSNYLQLQSFLYSYRLLCYTPFQSHRPYRRKQPLDTSRTVR